MKKKNLLVSCVALGLLLVGCKGNAGSESAAKSNSTSAVASKSASTSKSTTSTTSVAPKEQDPVQQTVVPDADGNGETISWDAQDANKESDNFTDAGKFSQKEAYVQYTFNATMAMKARLFVEMPPRTGSNDSAYDRHSTAENKGNQSIWYDYYNGPDWKYTVTVNSTEIDQNAMGTYKVGEEDVDFKELMYQDFLEEGASTLMAPWFEFNVKQGKNTIKIVRTQGYSVNMKSFKVVGKKLPVK